MFYRKVPKGVPRECWGKLRLTPEEAGARFGNYPDANTEIYICPVCSFLHFGHEPKRLRARTQRAIAAYRDMRYREKVQKQKQQLVVPKWKQDPRLSF